MSSISGQSSLTNLTSTSSVTNSATLSIEGLLLGRVALVAQRPIVVKLSRGRSVGLSVRTYVQCIVEKTADRIRIPFCIIGQTGLGRRQIVGFRDQSTGRRTFGANLGRAIVINGNFTAYVCDTAATRPSSQITLGRLVITPTNGSVCVSV